MLVGHGERLVHRLDDVPVVNVLHGAEHVEEGQERWAIRELGRAAAVAVVGTHEEEKLNRGLAEKQALGEPADCAGRANVGVQLNVELLAAKENEGCIAGKSCVDEGIRVLHGDRIRDCTRRLALRG